MKFSKNFFGVKNGDIHPTLFKAGDLCPDELLTAAKSVDALEQAEEPVATVKESLTVAAPKKKGKAND